jgi:hypothetical protein
MAMTRAWLVLVLAGCGAVAGPPRGEAYTPTNAAEAATQCPKEAAAAKEAREAALGTDAAQDSAARAVLAQADCERKAFDRLVLDSPDPEAFKQEIAGARTQFYNVKTLLDEVVSSGIPDLVAGAHVRLGDLHAAYADKLRRSDPGPAVAQDRQQWLEEVETVAAPVERAAAKEYDAALEVMELGPPSFVADAGLGAAATHACHELGARDREAATRHRLCQGR